MQHFVTVSSLKKLVDIIVSDKHMKDIIVSDKHMKHMPECILSKIMLPICLLGEISLQRIILLKPQGQHSLKYLLHILIFTIYT